MKKYEDVTGVILAGGRSSRFGQNKALSLFEGEHLIERLTRSLKEVTSDIILVTNTPDEYRFLGLPSYGDLLPDCGPLGGIYTALKTIDTPLALCIACDMPFVHADFMRFLIESSDGQDVIVPMRNEREEPLCAIYRTTCIPAIHNRISQERYKMIGFYDQVKVKRVSTEDTAAYRPHTLFNVNTQDDYQEAIKKLHEGE